MANKDWLGVPNYTPRRIESMKESFQALVERLVGEDASSGMTTSGDIAGFPKGFKVDDEDIPTPEETAQTGVGVTGAPNKRVEHRRSFAMRAAINESTDPGDIANMLTEGETPQTMLNRLLRVRSEADLFVSNTDALVKKLKDPEVTVSLPSGMLAELDSLWAALVKVINSVSEIRVKEPEGEEEPLPNVAQPAPGAGGSDTKLQDKIPESMPMVSPVVSGGDSGEVDDKDDEVDTGDTSSFFDGLDDEENEDPNKEDDEDLF